MQKNIPEAVERLKEYAEDNIRGFAIITKSESSFMKLLKYVLFFNKKFMKMTTVILNKMYTPDAKTFGTVESNDIHRDYALLRHELDHLLFKKELQGKYGRVLGAVAWFYLYMSPQAWAPFAVLGLLWWPLYLFALALAPWPAPGRVYAEKRAYVVSLQTYLDMGYSPDKKWAAAKAEAISGSKYYWASWSKQDVYNHLMDAMNDYKRKE